MFSNNTPCIKDWFPILKWANLPNFGNCHSDSDLEKFTKSYYCHNKIQKLYHNIVTTLDNGLSSQNIRLTGNPGAGKTSFLYAFKYMCEQEKPDNPLSKFAVYIIHINRTYDSNDNFYTSEADRHIICAWEHFYQKCKQGDAFKAIKGSSQNDKEIMNRLSDYYKNNKSDFGKIFIIAIDDVDLLKGDQVSHAVEHLLKNIEINSVKKWLSIRRVTLENYNGSTKKKIEEFFPDPYEFPDIPLSEILEYRIKNTSGNISESLNPYSDFLCNEIISPICEYNIRECLGLAKTILEDNLPGKFGPATDISVIHPYIQQASVKSLCASQKLIDLHSNSYRISSFPLSVDILGCLQFQTEENIIFAAVDDCCRKRNNLCQNPIGGKSQEFKLRATEFNDVIAILVSHNLIFKQGNRIQLTERGKVTIAFALRDFYFEYSENVNRLRVGSSLYWKLSSKKINHQEIIDLFITWSNEKNIQAPV